MSYQHPLKKIVGSKLRQHREAIGISGIAMAEALGVSQSKLSKIEAGKLRPSAALISAAARLLRLRTSDREDLLEGVRLLQTEVNSWRVLQHNGLAALQQTTAAVERDAEVIRSFAHTVIPGLLQTAEYARQILKLAGDTKARDLDAAVAARMGRQAILHSSKQFHFLVTESALRTKYVPDHAMTAQHEHLALIGKMPNVTLGILPQSARVPSLLWNDFCLLGSREVRVETLSAEISISDPESVRLYRKAFDALTVCSVSGKAADKLLKQTRK